MSDNNQPSVTVITLAIGVVVIIGIVAYQLLAGPRTVSIPAEAFNRAAVEKAAFGEETAPTPAAETPQAKVKLPGGKSGG